MEGLGLAGLHWTEVPKPVDGLLAPGHGYWVGDGGDGGEHAGVLEVALHLVGDG